MKNKIYTKAYVLELKKKQSCNINTRDRSLYQQELCFLRFSVGVVFWAH